ncbi:MAG: S-methyl-5-thioribose-1-phosphate isomerase, partial [Firmicutes bacterium]|nr:S-methyl-5-thioribose-1-phosphate isomerase [Bacillota bacterium]
MGDMVKSLIWEDGCLKLVDQTRLPMVFDVVECRTSVQVADAI